ncbi:sensor histidine kinase [Shewanella dokdonensis]|uniref:histidine kinase n=1 Tax=Shewanella dokdonensis TaxID=712036 RepID=A0ABX8DIP7_9GAMM|nr:HAMP domain-containing sensor histidine kinase [Shewanella dokdonensis]MCL1075667.1 HAMP domain-containing histidine kinase [Shewanella dokdonensis]QVK24663.1 HAMP domain-containing histidine kinase [Shewanella dokdonensis]
MVNWYQRQPLIYQIGLVILIGFALSFLLTLFLLSYDKSQRLNQLSVSGAVQRVIAVAETLQQTPASLHPSILNASSSSDLQLSLTDAPRVTTATSQTDNMSQRFVQRLYAAGIKEANLTLVSQPQRPLMDLSRHDMEGMRAMMNNGAMMRGSSTISGRNGPPFAGRGRNLNYSATIDGSVKLATGQWLNFSSGIETDITHWSNSVLIALVSVMLLTILLSLLVIRRALTPIAQLGSAALAFARNKQVQEVNNHAPRDLLPTINAFNAMQQQLTDYIKERTQLLAAISHDLRTPLTSLRLRAEFIEESEDKQQLLRTINTMEKMLTATMRFAKNDSNREARQMTNIDSLLQTIVDEYDERGVEINYQAQHGLTGNIPPVSVRRMTENLLNNAIQYAGNNAQISLTLAQDHEQLRICVADNGVGIPADKMQEVLKPFTRLSVARDTDSSNVGLGLSITHSLATAYGGNLLLQPNQPSGLQATIVLSLH